MNIKTKVKDIQLYMTITLFTIYKTLYFTAHIRNYAVCTQASHIMEGSSVVYYFIYVCRIETFYSFHYFLVSLVTIKHMVVI